MKSNFVLLFIIAIYISACSLFQSDTFSGSWKLKFGGDLQRVIEFVVAEDNTFEFDIEISLQGRTYPIVYRGTISEGGKLEAGIYFEMEEVGSLSGLCDYEKGEGTWYGGEYSGTWSAVKQ